MAHYGAWLLVLLLVVLSTVTCTIGQQRIVPRITRRAPPMLSIDETGAGGLDSEPNPITSDDDPLFFIVRGTW